MDSHFKKKLLKKISKSNKTDDFKAIFWDILYHIADRHGATLISSSVSFGETKWVGDFHEIYPTGLLSLRFQTLKDLTEFLHTFYRTADCEEFGQLVIDLLDGTVAFRGTWFDLELDFGNDLGE